MAYSEVWQTDAMRNVLVSGRTQNLRTKAKAVTVYFRYYCVLVIKMYCIGHNRLDLHIPDVIMVI